MHFLMYGRSSISQPLTLCTPVNTCFQGRHDQDKVLFTCRTYPRQRVAQQYDCRCCQPKRPRCRFHSPVQTGWLTNATSIKQ
jgi:hypothetical protein